jgi:hypothetical protein
MLMSVIGFWALKSNGLLLPDVNEGLQLLVMYPFTMWGSVASDLDHHWDSAPVKDAPSWCINMLLHLTTPVRKTMENGGSSVKKSPLYHLAGIFDASHRSWQTHSDLTLASVLLLLWAVLSGHLNFGFSVVDLSIIALVLTGICLGLVAHLVLDMITPEGAWSLLFVGVNKVITLVTKHNKPVLPEKIHFVPHSKFFATGGAWESMICRILKLMTFLSVVYILLLLFPAAGDFVRSLLPFEISFI